MEREVIQPGKDLEPGSVRAIQALACLALVSVGWLITLANFGMSDYFGNLVALIPGRDKTIHFFTFGSLAMLMSFAMRLIQAEFGRLKIFHGVILIFAFSTAEEFSQLLIATRTFDWLDLFCNYTGIACFGLLTALAARLLKAN